MKDLDFLRFFRNTIELDESNPTLQDLLCKSQTFREVVEKDCAFFARSGIIDYSLLLGRIKTEDDQGFHSLEPLYNTLAEDPSLSHGVYVTTEANGKPA